LKYHIVIFWSYTIGNVYMTEWRISNHRWVIKLLCIENVYHLYGAGEWSSSGIMQHQGSSEHSKEAGASGHGIAEMEKQRERMMCGAGPIKKLNPNSQLFRFWFNAKAAFQGSKILEKNIGQ
jgi:hypothetical protein